jgi:hypothetical protein
MIVIIMDPAFAVLDAMAMLMMRDVGKVNSSAENRYSRCPRRIEYLICKGSREVATFSWAKAVCSSPRTWYSPWTSLVSRCICFGAFLMFWTRLYAPWQALKAATAMESVVFVIAKASGTSMV